MGEKKKDLVNRLGLKEKKTLIPIPVGCVCLVFWFGLQRVLIFLHWFKTRAPWGQFLQSKSEGSSHGPFGTCRIYLLVFEASSGFGL